MPKLAGLRIIISNKHWSQQDAGVSLVCFLLLFLRKGVLCNLSVGIAGFEHYARKCWPVWCVRPPLGF